MAVSTNITLRLTLDQHSNENNSLMFAPKLNFSFFNKSITEIVISSWINSIVTHYTLFKGREKRQSRHKRRQANC